MKLSRTARRACRDVEPDRPAGDEARREPRNVELRALRADVGRSTQPLKSPAAAPRASHGASGRTSRRQSSRPRLHQNATRRAAGSVAVTVLHRSDRRTGPSAAA
jgi:hypothetical protein